MAIISTEQKQSKHGLLRIVIAVLVLVVIVFAAGQLGLLNELQDVEGLRAWIQGLGVVGFLAYVLLYIVAAVFMLPASAITIVAGITFGSVVGGALALVSATVGASVAFLIAKYIARDAIVAKFGQNPIFKRIESGVKENGTSFLILTRLVPVFPYNIQNYAYGVTPMKLSTFAMVSLVTMAPGAFIYAYMAGEIVTHGVSLNLLLQFAAAGFILFGISFIPKYIARKQGINIGK
ncbi:MAG: TVP38/TMEM64 family inner membrane protein YdjZ [Firmicutes bacterium]|nr:TVP38/TMEM64 family inner membrane protein YdjZ [Bacillota bacterium]